MGQTAAVTAQVMDNDLLEALPTANGLKRPILVPAIGEIRSSLQAAAKRAGMALVPTHGTDAPSVELDVTDTKAFIDTAKALGAKRLYLWNQSLHRRASLDVHLNHLEEALSETDSDTHDDEEREAASELAEELERAKNVLGEHGVLLYGAGFLLDGVMHEVYVTEDGLLDALIVLSALLDASGGSDDDLDEELHEMDPDEAAERIIEHVEEEMEVPPREMKRRANELARQAAHQLSEDDLSPADRQRVQQAVKIAAVKLRKG